MAESVAALDLTTQVLVGVGVLNLGLGTMVQAPTFVRWARHRMSLWVWQRECFLWQCNAGAQIVCWLDQGVSARAERECRERLVFNATFEDPKSGERRVVAYRLPAPGDWIDMGDYWVETMTVSGRDFAGLAIWYRDKYESSYRKLLREVQAAAGVLDANAARSRRPEKKSAAAPNPYDVAQRPNAETDQLLV